MVSIPLNLLSLYADIAQRQVQLNVPPASISRKRVEGHVHLYASIKTGEGRRQIYLGPANSPAAQKKAVEHQSAMRLRSELKTSIKALKRAGIRGPTVMIGRVLECMTQAGLFERGAVLVGTAAYQQFSCLVGTFLSEGGAQTEDADLAATRIALPRIFGGVSLPDVLKQADASFGPVYVGTNKSPRRLSSARGFMVEVLTTEGRRDGDVVIPGLGCSAIPLPFLDFLIEDPVEALVLYGSGLMVQVPQPARYGVHKLIVHQLRKGQPKAIKDLVQAAELRTALSQHDPNAWEDAVRDARKRGPSWRKFVDAGLRSLDHRTK